MTQAEWKVRELINHFGGVSKFGEIMGISDRGLIDQWVNRGSIPANRLASIVITANRKGLQFNLSAFAQPKGK